MRESTPAKSKRVVRKAPAAKKPTARKVVLPSHRPVKVRGKPGELRRDEATATIRRQIMAGSPGFRSGDILTETWLTAQLGLTLNPVRQALSQLANEGLVTILPRVGTQVRIVRPEEAQAILAMRYAIETIIVGELARTRPDLSELEAIVREMEQLAKHVSPNDQGVRYTFTKADMDFHVKMAELAHGYGTAGRTLRDLTSQYFLYASQAFQAQDSRTIMDKVVKDHSDILAALKACKNDPAAATKAMRLLHEHLRSSADRVVPFATSYLTNQVRQYLSTS